MEQDQPIMPEVEIFNARQYLADRVKRGVAFVAVLRTVGSEVEPCLSTHIREPQPEPPVQAPFPPIEYLSDANLAIELKHRRQGE